MTIYKGKSILLFGGIFEVTGEMNDVFVFDIPTQKWDVLEEDNRNASQSGSPRIKHPMIKDEKFRKSPTIIKALRGFGRSPGGKIPDSPKNEKKEFTLNPEKGGSS